MHKTSLYELGNQKTEQCIKQKSMWSFPLPFLVFHFTELRCIQQKFPRSHAISRKNLQKHKAWKLFIHQSTQIQLSNTSCLGRVRHSDSSIGAQHLLSRNPTKNTKESSHTPHHHWQTCIHKVHAACSHEFSAPSDIQGRICRISSQARQRRKL